MISNYFVKKYLTNILGYSSILPASRDVIRPIAHEKKLFQLMDYNAEYLLCTEVRDGRWDGTTEALREQ